MKVPFLDLKRDHNALSQQLEDAAREALRSGWYVLGPNVDQFEQEFAAFCQVEFAVGVASGLDAIELILEAAGIGEGDEVIVPSNTYIATWLGVSNVGATPIPVEPDEQTRNIDPNRVEAAITSKTRAIFSVDLYGEPAPMAELRDIAQRHNLRLFSDAAQSHGALLGGSRAASLADATAFSFYPTKNLGAAGDGGCVVTNDEELASAVQLRRNYGSPKKYVNELLGRNSRLDELQAALLRVKLSHLDAWNETRRRLAAIYDAELGELETLRRPNAPTETMTPVYHVYAVQLHSDRDAVAEKLAVDGVGTLIHYPTPPHLSAAYSEYRDWELPLAERLAATTLSLPMSPFHSEEEIRIAAATLRSVLR